MIRIGLLGVGHAHAGGKLRVLEASPEFEVVGVAAEDAELQERRRSTAPFEAARWVGVDELLEDRSVVAVAVESRVGDNLRLARRALEAGKHIHLDKPAGSSLPEFRALLDLARERDLLVQMGYMFRYNAGCDRIRQALREGWIGAVYAIHGTINSDIAPASRAGLAEFAGGMMFELGCHLIDTLVGLLGRPDEVTPFTRHDGAQPDNLADNTVAVFEFERAIAILESAAMEPEAGKRRQLEVCGTDGTIVLQPIEPPAVRLCLRQPRGGYQAGWQSIPVTQLPRYVRDFEDFAACIRGERQPSYDYEHDYTVQETVLRASGMPV